MENKTIRNTASSHFIAIYLHDLLMVALAFAGAFVIRYNFNLPAAQQALLVSVLPLVLLVHGIVLWRFKLHRSLWRFTSVADLWNICWVAIIGSLATAVALFMLIRLEGVPRSVFVLFPLLLIFFMGGSRLVYRYLLEQNSGVAVNDNARRLAIIGAGRAGELLERNLRRDPGYFLVGFLDDDPELVGRKIHGAPVLGRTEQMVAIIREQEIDLLVIAIPSASGQEIRRVVELCESTGVEFRTVPRLQDILSGVSVGAIREVSIEDLLGRDAVDLDWKKIDKGLTGKVILVTGGGGSIGSELCRQICRVAPASLVILDHSEFNLYNIERELRAAHPGLKIEACLGSVCDHAAVNRLFEQVRPNVVYHAAAYKHVPMLQGQIREAMRNNILGTHVVAMAADRHGSDKFILISTDKAVNPGNIMGATKRSAEILCQNLDTRSDTDFITVRFGNVLDSAGSVVPLFKEQIRNGGPVTVTHPEITRCFMTITEASQLIMQASVMGQGGEIFVLDMGLPIRIAYFAEQMIRLSGKEPGVDMEIVYTGLRPGEKLYEELFHESEALRPTASEKILLSGSRRVEWDRLESVIARISDAVDAYQERILTQLLRDLVPEYHETRIENPATVVSLRAYARDGGEGPA